MFSTIYNIIYRFATILYFSMFSTMFAFMFSTMFATNYYLHTQFNKINIYLKIIK